MDRDLVIDVGDVDSAADDLVAPCHGSAAVGPSLDGVARGGTWPANGPGSGLLLQQLEDRMTTIHVQETSEIEAMVDANKAGQAKMKDILTVAHPA